MRNSESFLALSSDDLIPTFGYVVCSLICLNSYDFMRLSHRTIISHHILLVCAVDLIT